MTTCVERGMPGYVCRTCGRTHSELPLHYGADAPFLYCTIPEEERAIRCELSSEICVIDRKYFFIVGNLELPIVDEPKDVFSWDVWVSLSDLNFRRTIELWDQPGREREPPYFGWFSTRLPLYPDTLHLKTQVHTRAVGQRPLIELEPTEHPLAREQRDGISWDRVREIAEKLQHAEP